MEKQKADLSHKEECVRAFCVLSRQEKHVLLLLSEGMNNRGLFLEEGTVRNYVSSILTKLNAHNRAEAAAYALRHNLQENIS